MASFFRNIFAAALKPFRRVRDALLIQTSKYNQAWAVSLLIRFGADINALDKSNHTALHYATLNRNLKITKILLSHGAALDYNRKIFNPYITFNALVNSSLDIPTLQIISTLFKISMHNLTDPTQLRKQILTQVFLKLAKINIFPKILKETVEKYELDILAKDAVGNTLLHYAAKYNDYSSAKFLVNCHKNAISVRNKSGEMPIHLAATYHSNNSFIYDGGVLKFLINSGADLDAQDYAGNTALQCAVSRLPELTDPESDLEKTINATLDILAKQSFSSSFTTDKKQRTLLHTAAIAQNLLAMQYFYDYIPLDADAQDYSGATALHNAIYHANDVPMIDFLLRHNADPLIQDNYGNAPLHYFARRPKKRLPVISDTELTQEINTIECLAKHQWTLQMLIRNNLGQTALHTVISEVPCLNEDNLKSNPGLEIVKKMLALLPQEKIMIIINKQDNEGNTLLHKICEYNPKSLYGSERQRKKYAKQVKLLEDNATELVKLLVELGGDLSIINASGQTPLAIAKDCGTAGTVEYLQSYLPIKKQLLVLKADPAIERKGSSIRIVYPAPRSNNDNRFT